MIMDMGLALVLTLRVPVREVRMAHGCMVVLMRVAGVEMIETARHLVVIVSHVKVMVGVD